MKSPLNIALKAARREADAKTDTPEGIEINEYPVGEVIRRFAPYLAPHKVGIGISAVLIAITGASMALIPLFTKYVIDTAIPARSLKLTLAAMGLFLLSQLIRMSCWFAAQDRLLWIREDIIYALRRQSFRHLQRLCMRFHGLYPSGYLHDRVFERAINGIGGFMAVILSNLTVYGVGLSFALLACAWLNIPMTLLLLFSACAYVWISKRLSPEIHKRSLLANEAHTQIHAFILDKIRGTKTVQALSLEEQVEEDFESRIEPTKRKWVAAQRGMLKLRFVTEGIGYVITALVHVVGVWAIFDMDMQLGTLVAFVGYQAQFINFTAQLANVYGQFSMAQAGADQLLTVLDTRSTVADKPGAPPPPSDGPGEIRFEDVGFSYGDRQVISDLTLTLAPGETLALVGRSGSGKTTVSNLLMRFYDPNHGRLTLDGHDVREFSLRDYRSQFGVVLQEPYLFNDSVAANLRVARPEADDQLLWETLERAQAADYVRELPGDLEFEIGEAGCRLSGGQRQRLAIARCLLLDARFLVLDEATSALDVETERDVQQAMDALFKDHTAVVIAHRLSTIRRAHRIAVLDEGRLVEIGAYDDLVQRGGLFSKLHQIATSSSLRKIKIDEAGFA